MSIKVESVTVRVNKFQLIITGLDDPTKKKHVRFILGLQAHDFDFMNSSERDEAFTRLQSRAGTIGYLDRVDIMRLCRGLFGQG